MILPFSPFCAFFKNASNLIFDFCGNFEFFRLNKGKATANTIPIQGAIFHLQFEISYKLQDIAYQTERLIAYRKALVTQMSEKVQKLQKLQKKNFAVRQHLRYIETYSNESNYQRLTYEDTLIVRDAAAWGSSVPSPHPTN